MGEVWRARDERLGRDVAIKLLLPHPSNGAERVRAFLREARAAGTLNHTNVLTVYDVGEHGGAPYLVTECLEGQSLRARLGAGALAGGRGARHRAPGRPRARCGPRARHRPSRPEAREHLPRAPTAASRSSTSAWRRCTSAAAPAPAPELARRDRAIARRRHRRLHGTGAGARRGRRWTRGHLRARCRAPRDARRPPAVQGRQHARDAGRGPDASSLRISRR